ncbi:hypothetical protein ACHAWF_016843 [Thalassiosira exigua]
MKTSGGRGAGDDRHGPVPSRFGGGRDRPRGRPRGRPRPADLVLDYAPPDDDGYYDYDDDDDDDDGRDRGGPFGLLLGLPRRLANSLLGPIFGPLLAPDSRGDPDELRSRLRWHSSSLLGASTFFWIWAVHNTLGHLRFQDGFDLGVFSFFGSGVSSALLLRSASGGTFRCFDCLRRGKKDDGDDDDEELDAYGIPKRPRDDLPARHAPPRRCLRLFALLTHLIVSANYALGTVFAFAAGNEVYVYFAAYCVAFGLLWLVAAGATWTLVSSYRESVRRVYGDEVVDGPPPPPWRRGGAVRAALIFLAGRAAGGAASAAGGGGYCDGEAEEEDDIDDELRALYEGRGGYTQRATA